MSGNYSKPDPKLRVGRAASDPPDLTLKWPGGLRYKPVPLQSGVMSSFQVAPGHRCLLQVLHDADSPSLLPDRTFGLWLAAALRHGRAQVVAVPPPPSHEWTRLPPIVEPTIPEPEVPPHVSQGLLPPPDVDESEPAEESYWFWPYSWLDAASGTAAWKSA